VKPLLLPEVALRRPVRLARELRRPRRRRRAWRAPQRTIRPRCGRRRCLPPRGLRLGSGPGLR
jgi:hypothetical protein